MTLLLFHRKLSVSISVKVLNRGTLKELYGMIGSLILHSGLPHCYYVVITFLEITREYLNKLREIPDTLFFLVH